MSNRVRTLLVALCIALSALPFPALAEPPPHQPDPSVAILFTNDIHSYYDRCIGYDGLILLRKELEQRYAHVILVDGGDAIQGAPIGAISNGSELIRIMNEAGYDIAVLGNHEFDYGFYTLDDLQKRLNCGYICANFCTADGEPVYDPYRLLSLGDTQIAFIGVVTPYAFSKSSIHTMTDDTGVPLYDFKLDETGEALNACLQGYIDEVRAKGADRVILVGHLGNNTEMYTSRDVISHLKGLDAFIDAHSHQAYDTTAPDADGRPIPLAQTGSYFSSVGVMILGADGSIDIELISEVPAPEPWMEGIEATEVTRGNQSRWVDADAHMFLEAITDAYAPTMNKHIGTSSYDLNLSAADGSHNSLSHENGLCELVADAYRETAGADISIINAASVRNSLPAGEITYNTLLNILPYSNDVLIARVSGQTILDVLEFGCHKMPNAWSGFPQVSGLEFTVDITVESGAQTDEKGDFIGVAGPRRVRDVLVNGEPINPERLYTMAATAYFLEGGDNFRLLAENAEVIGSTMLTDNMLLAGYIEGSLNGVIPAKYLHVSRIHEAASSTAR